MTRSSRFPIDLHDANLVRYERERDQLTAFISKWNGTKVTLVFRDVCLVEEFDAVGPPNQSEGNLSELRESFDTALIQETRQCMKTIHCSEAEMENVRHYQLVDDGNAPTLEVIAYSMEIRHESHA